MLGLFYDREDENEVINISFMETIQEYSFEDFWNMVISAGLMIFVTILFKIIFKQRNVENSHIKKVRVCNLIRRILGMGFAWIMMSLFCYGIVIFSVSFTKRRSFMWFFNSLITILANNLLFELIKIMIISYCLYLYSSLTYKRRKRQYEEENQGSPSVSESDDKDLD